MPNNLKLGISLLILVSIFFMCVSVGLFFVGENEKDKRLFLENKIEEIVKAKDDLKKTLDDLEVINKDLESKLSSTHQQIKSLSEDYAREKGMRESLAAELYGQKKEAKELIDDIMEAKEQRVGFIQKLAQAEDGYRKLKAQLQVVVQAKETLEKKVKEIIAQKGVELEKIIVQPGGFYPEMPAYESGPPAVIERDIIADGEVLVVNKKFDFVIVNLGKSNGLGLGDGLEIRRGGKFIAEARIEKLYNQMSAASILPQYKSSNIKQGDEVIISR